MGKMGKIDPLEISISTWFFEIMVLKITVLYKIKPINNDLHFHLKQTYAILRESTLFSQVDKK